MCATPGVGCALFTVPAGTDHDTSRPNLPPLRPALDAVQLQVVLIDRPEDDPTLQRLVWNEVDQVGATPPAVRTILADNGLRVGQCGANPPPSMQTLLGWATQRQSPLSTENSATSSYQLSLLSGQDSEVLVNGPFERSRVRFVLNGQEEWLEFEQTRCVLRIRPTRLEDGWVKLEITPEIHHGESRLRHAATGDGWTFRPGQLIEVRQALKFQLTLNTGEIALVGAGTGSPEALGSLFFRQEREGQLRQRLVVIRVADTGRAPSRDRSHP